MKNKKKQRKVLLAILMIVITGVTLSVSTYAWFTANKVVTVSDINVNVASTNGLQMSVDGINWKTVISNDDINGAVNTYAAAVNQLPSSTTSLAPVSTIGEINTTNGFLKMFLGDIDSNADGDYILTTTNDVEQNGTAGSFVAFDLFLQVTNETPIYLTDASKAAATGSILGIENAARMAFVVEGNTAAGSAVSAIQGLKATTGSENVVIWELNNDAHTAAAVSNASDNYGITTTAVTSGATPIEYYGVKVPIVKADNILLDSTSSAFFSKVTPTISTGTAGISADAYQSLITLQPGITKVRVYMWLEGQDVDCENNASGGSLVFNVQISSNSSASA